MAADDAPVYVISVAAERAGVHPQTLRSYERHGLISPQRTRGGSRRYTEADIARLRRIQQLTAEGLSLGAVQRFLDLERRFAAARAEIAELRRLLDRSRPEPRRELVRRSDLVNFFARRP